MAQSESRGVKDVFKVRRQQERAAKMEQAELEAAQHGEASLRVRRINSCSAFLFADRFIYNSYSVFYSHFQWQTS